MSKDRIKLIKEMNLKLEDQYQLHLQRMRLTEEEMHPQQKVQLRRAFMADCGQLIILMTDVVGETEKQDAMKVIEDLMQQIENCWQEQRK